MRIGVQEFGGHVGRGSAVSQNYLREPLKRLWSYDVL